MSIGQTPSTHHLGFSKRHKNTKPIYLIGESGQYLSQSNLAKKDIKSFEEAKKSLKRSPSLYEKDPILPLDPLPQNKDQNLPILDQNHKPTGIINGGMIIKALVQ